MTDEERREEGAEGAVEDLEAPAGEQDDVAGGKCMKPTVVRCYPPTCKQTIIECHNPPRDTETPIVSNQ